MRPTTEREMARLCDRIRDLPRLATEAGRDTPGGSTMAARTPPGLDLRTVDAGREHPHLLARISQCVRTVVEEMPRDTYLRSPDLPDRPTWLSETSWLLQTVGWWQGDDWCTEWIDTEVRAITDALHGLIEQHSLYRTCSVCGAAIEAYRTGDYAIAECRSCSRVIGMADVGTTERMTAARRLLRSILEGA